MLVLPSGFPKFHDVPPDDFHHPYFQVSACLWLLLAELVSFKGVCLHPPVRQVTIVQLDPFNAGLTVIEVKKDVRGAWVHSYRCSI
jgi:hypothetical protein